MTHPTTNKGTSARTFTEHYAFTDEELGFINYDVKYRMGVEGE